MSIREQLDCLTSLRREHDRAKYEQQVKLAEKQAEDAAKFIRHDLDTQGLASIADHMVFEERVTHDNGPTEISSVRHIFHVNHPEIGPFRLIHGSAEVLGEPMAWACPFHSPDRGEGAPLASHALVAWLGERLLPQTEEG